MLSVILALASAFSNAVNLVSQHVASTASTPKDKGWRLALYLVRNPLWLFGVVAMVAAFVLQSLALYHGLLSVVQSILVTEIIFTLVLGRFWLKRDVATAAWASASITTVGLAVFLAMSEPKGGHQTATKDAWLPAMLTVGGLAFLCVLGASRGSPLRRGAFYAGASGIIWAILATCLKSVTEVLASSGLGAVLQQGPIYGLIVAGIAGTITTQAALHNGPLAVSQPIMVIVDPIVAIVLSVWLYGEHFGGGPSALAWACLGFLAMIVGVVFLARTAPSFEAVPAPPAT